MHLFFLKSIISSLSQYARMYKTQMVDSIQTCPVSRGFHTVLLNLIHVPIV